MSKYWNNRKIISRYIGKTIIKASYRGLLLIWKMVESCFGAGYWDNKSAWNNNDGWSN